MRYHLDIFVVEATPTPSDKNILIEIKRIPDKKIITAIVLVQKLC